MTAKARRVLQEDKKRKNIEGYFIGGISVVNEDLKKPCSPNGRVIDRLNTSPTFQWR